MKVAFLGKTLLSLGIAADDPETYYLAQDITTVIFSARVPQHPTEVEPADQLLVA